MASAPTQDPGEWLGGAEGESASIELGAAVPPGCAARTPPQTRSVAVPPQSRSTLLRQRCSGCPSSSRKPPFWRLCPRHRTGRPLLCSKCLPEQRGLWARGSPWPSHRSPASRPPVRPGCRISREGFWSGFGGSGDPCHPSARTGEENHANDPTPLITVRTSTRKSVSTDEIEPVFAIPWIRCGFALPWRVIGAVQGPRPTRGASPAHQRRMPALPRSLSFADPLRRFCFRRASHQKGSANW